MKQNYKWFHNCCTLFWCFFLGWLVGWFIYEVSSGNIAKTKECPLKLLLLLFYADSAFCLFYCCCTSHVMMSVDLVCVWFYIGMCVSVRALSCVCLLFIIIDLPRQLFCNIIYIYNFILLTDITFTGFCSCCCYCCRCHVILFNYMLSSGLRPTSSLEFLG